MTDKEDNKGGGLFGGLKLGKKAAAAPPAAGSEVDDKEGSKKGDDGDGIKLPIARQRIEKRKRNRDNFEDEKQDRPVDFQVDHLGCCMLRCLLHLLYTCTCRNGVILDVSLSDFSLKVFFGLKGRWITSFIYI